MAIVVMVTVSPVTVALGSFTVVPVVMAMFFTSVVALAVTI